MYVEWNGERYEVAIKEKQVAKIKLSVAKGGKVVATVPARSTEAEVQQFLDEKAEWIAKTISNAKNGVKKQRATPAGAGRKQATSRDALDTDPFRLAHGSKSASAKSESLLSSAGGVEVMDIEVQVLPDSKALRTTLHIVGPLQVAATIPLGTSQKEAAAFTEAWLSSINRDELNPRGLRRPSPIWPDDFPFFQVMQVPGGRSTSWLDNVRVYASRKDVPDYTYEPIGADEVWVYVPWDIPASTVDADIRDRGLDILNAVGEYAYRKSDAPAAIEDIWKEQVTWGDVSYDIVISRKRTQQVHFYISPLGIGILQVPWYVSNLRVKDFVQELAQELVEQIAEARNETRMPLFSEDPEVSCVILGQELRLVFAPDESQFVEETPDSLIVHAPEEEQARIVLAIWSQSTLQSIIQSIVDKWLPVLRPQGVKEVTFSVEDIGVSWSIRQLNTSTIYFDVDLLSTPRDTVEFVVLEQLVALIPDRSLEWHAAFLEQHMPDWRERERALHNDVEEPDRGLMVIRANGSEATPVADWHNANALIDGNA